MMKCEGYIMYRGRMTVTPVCKAIDPFLVHGTFLYKPDTRCWYVGNDSPEKPGSSFASEICSEFVEQI